jgi:hypothetical protein
MSSLVYLMPMPCCSNCGKQLLHLYEDHVNLSKKLSDELKDHPGSVPEQDYRGEISGKDITEFIVTYYTWKKNNPDEEISFQPHNVVARGLLSLKQLEPNMLPFGMDREQDGQLSIFSEPVCCLRMFQCNPSFSVN